MFLLFFYFDFYANRKFMSLVSVKIQEINDFFEVHYLTISTLFSPLRLYLFVLPKTKNKKKKKMRKKSSLLFHLPSICIIIFSDATQSKKRKKREKKIYLYIALAIFVVNSRYAHFIVSKYIETKLVWSKTKTEKETNANSYRNSLEAAVMRELTNRFVCYFILVPFVSFFYSLDAHGFHTNEQ